MHVSFTLQEHATLLELRLSCVAANRRSEAQFRPRVQVRCVLHGRPRAVGARVATPSIYTAGCRLPTRILAARAGPLTRAVRARTALLVRTSIYEAFSQLITDLGMFWQTRCCCK